MQTTKNADENIADNNFQSFKGYSREFHGLKYMMLLYVDIY